MTDPWEHPDAIEFVENVRRHLIPRIRDATTSLTFFTGGEPDVKLSVELGLSILLDKPIILCVTPGAKVPNKLAKVADDIIEIDPSDPATAAAKIAAIIHGQ